MFRTVPLSINRNFSLYTQQWYMSYRFIDSLRTGSGWNWVPSWSYTQAVRKPVWLISLLCVQWKTPDDGQRNCPKHVEFNSKNKFKILVHLIWFIIKIYHDARSPEHQTVSHMGHNPIFANPCLYCTNTLMFHTNLRNSPIEMVLLYNLRINKHSMQRWW